MTAILPGTGTLTESLTRYTDRTSFLFLSVAFRSVTAMSAIEAESASADALVVRLDRMLADLAAAVADNTVAADVDRIERIARLEKLRAATAACRQ